MVSFQIVNIEDIVTPYFNYKSGRSKTTILLIILGIFILVVLFARKSFKDNCNTTQNRYIIHQDEVLPNIVYYAFRSEQVKHILWTGGYDSTFLLCYYFIVVEQPVQPIYIMCGNIDNRFGFNGRKSQQMELNTMKHIRKELIKRYPHKQGRLLPTYYVTSVAKNNDITRKFAKLHKRNGYFSRSVTQYERIARLSKDWPYPLLIGLEKCGTGLDEATEGKRVGKWEKCMIKSLKELPPKERELDIFRNIRFPICHLTKENMKEISLDSKNYFYDILLMTWSCWYPQKDGKPRGECQMCKKRIL